eukprot:gene6550-8997_t
MWSSNFFGRLLPHISNVKTEHNTSHTNADNNDVEWPSITKSEPDFTESKHSEDEIGKDLMITTIGPILWDSKFISDFSEPKAKVLDAPIEKIVEATANVDQTRSKRSKDAKKSVNALYEDLCRADIEPHLMVTPFLYSEENGPAPNEEQPFKIVVHPQVSIVCDIHSHLSNAEVIGFLAGKWDDSKKMLYIQAAFPCTAIERVEDNGSTDVELDPEAEFMVRETIFGLGMQVVGWYHSHPLFKPNPSVVDIHNQRQYQSLMADPNTLLEPFVGLIVSAYDQALITPAAHHQWFHVKPYSPSAGKRMIDFPMIINVSYLELTNNFSDSIFSYNCSEALLLSEIFNKTYHNEDGSWNTSMEGEPPHITDDSSIKEEEKTKRKRKRKSSMENTLEDEAIEGDLNLNDEEHVITLKSTKKKSSRKPKANGRKKKRNGSEDDIYDNDEDSETDIKVDSVEDTIINAIPVAGMHEELNSDIKQDDDSEAEINNDNESVNETVSVSGVEENKVVVDDPMDPVVVTVSGRSGRAVKPRTCYGEFTDSSKLVIRRSRIKKKKVVKKPKAEEKKKIKIENSHSENSLTNNPIPSYNDFNDGKKEKFISVTKYFKGSSKVAEMSRKLLFNVLPQFRGITLVIITLGIYYSKLKSRSELNRKWKTNITRGDKLKFSAMQWVIKLGLASEVIVNSQETNPNEIIETNPNQFQTYSSIYIDEIVNFLLICWKKDK